MDGKVVHAGDYFSNKEGKKLTVFYVSENANTQYYTTAAPQMTEAPVTTTEPVTQAPTTAAPAPTDPPPTDPPATDPPAPPEQPVEGGGEGGEE